QRALNNLTASAGKAEGATGRLSASFETLGKFAVQALALAGVSLTVSGLISDITSVEGAVANLNAKLIATGGAAGYTSQQLQELATAQARQTGISRESI